MNKIFIFVFCIVFSVKNCFSDDCLQYKISPRIFLSFPIWKKEVVQPLKPMDFLHGNVSATFTENYEIVINRIKKKNGFCVILKSVKARLGYSDFLVKIDSRHIPGSCIYNAVLNHEDEHIKAYLSIIEEGKNKIEKSIFSAANSITPIFIENENELEKTFDFFNLKIATHPDIILMKRFIKAEEEIRNKKVDINDPEIRIKNCLK